MELTTIIPARRKTVKFKWAYKNYIQATQKYFDIRKGSMTRCDWCKKQFEKDEWFGLAQTMPGQEGPKRNWALCNDCADLMGAPDRIQVQGKEA